jgi:glycerol-3-phosphate dehydrogenase subunit B
MTARRVLVAGGGMSGTMAAISAREAGAEVTLVMAGPGASSLSNGVIEISWPAQGEAAAAAPDKPLRFLRTALSGAPDLPGRVAARLSPLFDAPLGGSVGTALYATVIGTHRPGAVMQRAQTAGRLERGRRYAVAGFPMQPALVDAELVALSLVEDGFSAAACRPDYLDRDEDAWRTSFELAANLDDPRQVERLAGSLRRVVTPGTETVLLPPVLGLTRSDVAEQLSRAVGLRCAELLPVTPSVPGLRLSRALSAARDVAGVRVVLGRVAALRDGHGELESGEVISFDAAVLATGRFIGGGIVRRGRTREGLAELPVSDGRDPLPDESGSGPMAGEEVGGVSALFRAGVEVDAAWRAIGAGGRALPWLHAAGGVLAGADGAVDGTGLGFAAFTGWLAGESASARRDGATG